MINIRTNKSDHRIGLVVIMNEIMVQATVAKHKIDELLKQVNTLAVGLQNAALGEKGASNPTIEYLFAIAEGLDASSKKLEEIIDPNIAPANNDTANRPKV